MAPGLPRIQSAGGCGQGPGLEVLPVCWSGAQCRQRWGSWGQREEQPLSSQRAGSHSFGAQAGALGSSLAGPPQLPVLERVVSRPQPLRPPGPMGGVLLNWAGEALKGPAGVSEGSEGVHPAAGEGGTEGGRAGGGPRAPRTLRGSSGLPGPISHSQGFPGRSSESRRPALAARGPGLAIPAAGPQLSLGFRGWPGPGHQVQDAPWTQVCSPFPGQPEGTSGLPHGCG